MPGRTDIQSEFDIAYGGPEAGTLWIRRPDFTVTPRTSYYLCIMGHSVKDSEPNDILYFAIAGNAETLLSSRKVTVGHQYLKSE